MNENINTPMVSVIVPAYKVPGIRGRYEVNHLYTNKKWGGRTSWY